MSNYRFDDESTLRERVKKLPFIKSQKIEWCPLKRNKKYIEMPYPKYNREILKWIDDFYNLKLVEYNYTENYENYKEKIIEQLTDEELLSYLTFLIRGERFCDGMIATNLENGTIELLEKKLFSYLIAFIEIDDNNLNDFEEKDVMFFSLAEGGAMGEPNGIEIITKKENDIKLYRTNILNFDVKKLYSKFSTLKTLNCGIFETVTGVQNGFIHVDIGVGNHLFINDSINNLFQEKIKGLQPVEIYSRWLNIGLDILNYDWSNNNG